MDLSKKQFVSHINNAAWDASDNRLKKTQPKSVRDALEDAALKLTSAAELSAPRIRPVARDGDDWMLSSENPAFSDSETATPRDDITTEPQATPSPQSAAALSTPNRQTTPRSARGMPGSAQKEEANNFPKSYPVTKPAYADTKAGESFSPFGNALRFFFIAVLVLLILGAGVAFLPATMVPKNFGHTSSLYFKKAVGTELYISHFTSWAAKFLPSNVVAPTMSSASKTTTLPAMVALGPQSLYYRPGSVSSNVALSHLRWQSVVGAVKNLYSRGNSVEGINPTAQHVLQSVETPLKVVSAAMAGIVVATIIVAGLLHIWSAAPLKVLSSLKFTVHAADVLGHRSNTFADMDGGYGQLEQAEEEFPEVHRRSATRRKKKPSSATPRSTRRLVSTEAIGNEDTERVSSRRAWRRASGGFA